MTWETSIFNDDRSRLDSWQNRDSDTHMEIDRNDLMNPRETTYWEKDLVEAECKHFSSHDEIDMSGSSDEMGYAPDR